MMRHLIQTWNSAKDDPANGQLTYRAWNLRTLGSKTTPAFGLFDQVHVEQQWWVNPKSWSIGISIDSVDWLPGGYDGRRGITVEIGPFILAVDLCQPLRAEVARRERAVAR